jgi:hypothetical protein
MEAKLIKMMEGYIVSLTGDIDDIYAITNKELAEEHGFYSLSLKNCQAIERGYDLDELFNKVDSSIDYHEFDFTSFKHGANAILEILGDKKFSEEDMVKCFNASMDEGWVRADFYIQSLQQTEWDVEIEMICPHPMDTYRCGLQYGCDGDGCNHPEQVPYLDQEGCLILKRK